MVLTSVFFLFGCSDGGGSPGLASTNETSSAASSGASGAIPNPGGTTKNFPTVMSRNDRLTCILKNNRVFCLRVSPSRSSTAPVAFHEITMPTQPAGTTQEASTITAVAVGGPENGCVIRDGRTICWGIRLDETLETKRLSNTTYSKSEGRYIRAIPNGASSVGIGPHTGCIIDKATTCWGNNTYGQLGDGTNHPGSYVVSPEGLSSEVSAIRIGGIHACAIVNGAAKCWGSDVAGKLLPPRVNNPYAPTQVQGLESGVKAISLSGGSHICALVKRSVRPKTSAVCWGRNNYGQLGNGNTTDQLVPVSVLIPGGIGLEVEAVSVGHHHSCAVVEGRAMCWGRNDHGQLGSVPVQVIGTTSTNQSVPIPVPGLQGQITAISASKYQSCALVADGKIYCWGKHGDSGGNFLDSALLPVTPTRVMINFEK